MCLNELQKKTLESERFAGYQKIALAGLGTIFWGTATGVLSQLKKKLGDEEKKPDWVHSSLHHWVRYSAIYGTVGIMLMLVGLCASTFPSSSPCAASIAGLGGCQALIFILGTFHIASLNYYSSTEQCFYCFLGASGAVIFYWGLSAQDPWVWIFLHCTAY